MIATSHQITLSAMMSDPRYARLDDDDKADLQARLAFCFRIDDAKNKRAAFAEEARRSHAGEFRSADALRKLYYDKWLASGRNWWSIRNEARVPAESNALPPETVLFWHQLCFRFGGRRRHKAAHRELKRMWESGAKIDGVAEAQPRRRTGLLPAGLSYGNLMKKRYRPKPLADIVAGIGLKAAHSHLPGLLTTRAGLPFGARYVFDDAKHDFMTTVPKQLGARELWQFHCLELLSAYQVARGYKAATLNAKTESMEKLKERELLFLIAHLFCSHGYNPEGCIAMMERGTATVREAIERLLYDLSGRKILVQRGATSTGALAPGLYGGQSGGNPRFKAALESLTNLIHIETSDRLLLPAQTGSNARIDRPEELYGREQHLTLLQKALLAVPEEQRELLRLPAPPLWQAISFADAIQERMNWREDHELEGWESCGFIVPLWRLHEQADFEPQTSLSLLAPDERAILERRILANPKLTSARRMSPGEVFHGYRDTLTRLPDHALPMLVGMEYAEERRVDKDGDFHFSSDDLGPDEHHYQGELVDGDGQHARVPAGEKFATFVSAIDPKRMYLCNAKGRYVGYVERLHVPSKADAHGFARAAGRKMQAHRELLAPVLAAARPLWRRQMADAEVNDTVFAQAAGARAPQPPKPEQRARQRRRAQIDADVAAATRTAETHAPAAGGLYDEP